MVIKALLFVFGFLLGFVVCSMVWTEKQVGLLRRISDPDEPGSDPYLYLELDRDKLHLLENNRYILLQVKDNNATLIPRSPQK